MGRPMCDFGLVKELRIKEVRLRGLIQSIESFFSKSRDRSFERISWYQERAEQRISSKEKESLFYLEPSKVHRFKEMLMRVRGNDFGGERHH